MESSTLFWAWLIGLFLSSALVAGTFRTLLGRQRALMEQLQSVSCFSNLDSAEGQITRFDSPIASAMFWMSAADGLADIRLRYRPSNDAPATLLELFTSLPDRPQPLNARCLLGEIRVLYLLQHTLLLDGSTIAAALDCRLDSFAGLEHNGAEIGSVESIGIGALVDEVTMWPRTAGLRVAQPLGPCVRSTNGGILEKAQVLCTQ